MKKSSIKSPLNSLFSILLLNFILIINYKLSYSKKTFFQLLSSSDQFAQVSFQSDTKGYILRNFNNGTTSIFDFESTEILVEFNNNPNENEISFNKPLELNTKSLEIFMESKGSNIIYEETNQFYLYEFEDFQNVLKDWSYDSTSICGKSDNLFLGGPCKLANNTVEKTYKDLPEHSQVRITANFHFFDDWNGEDAYMMINDFPVWSDSYSWCPGSMQWMCLEKAINVCGNERADRLSVPIDITIDHSDSSFKLGFLSIIAKQPCEASWGVDDIGIYLR